MEGWVKISGYDSLQEAEYQMNLLITNGVEASIVNEKDSSFLFGEVELFVSEENVEQALKLIEELNAPLEKEQLDFEEEINNENTDPEPIP